VGRGRTPSRATRPDRPPPAGHPDALAVGARIRLALAYHAAAGTPGRPTDVAELAQAMEANLGALRAVLAGHRGPPASWGRSRGRVTIERLAQALGCPVEALSPTAPPRWVLPRPEGHLDPLGPVVADLGSACSEHTPTADELERAWNLSLRIGR